MNTANLDFATYCIGNLSRRLGLSPRDVYQRLKRSGILTGYIIPSDHYLAEEIWQEHSA